MEALVANSDLRSDQATPIREKPDGKLNHMVGSVRLPPLTPLLISINW